MGKPRLFIVIVALALATMACSLGSANKASDSQTPTALPPVTALVQSASPVSTPAPTQTPVPTATVVVVAEVAPEVNDLGIIDDANGANSANLSNGGGEEAVAIESLSSIQNVEAQFYIPNCMPVTDWPLYTVVSGDTLHKIAAQFNTSWKNVANANCLANPNLIYVGQGLVGSKNLRHEGTGAYAASR